MKGGNIMAKAKNKVVAGDYTGASVGSALSSAYISKGVFGTIDLDSKSVRSYELVAGEQNKSFSSGVARGVIGGAVLGPIGLIAGAATAKSKGIYHIAINFKNGKRSLLEVDDKIYKAIVKSCF